MSRAAAGSESVWPWPIPATATGRCNYCHRQFRGMLRNWRLAACYLRHAFNPDETKVSF